MLLFRPLGPWRIMIKFTLSVRFWNHADIGDNSSTRFTGRSVAQKNALGSLSKMFWTKTLPLLSTVTIPNIQVPILGVGLIVSFGLQKVAIKGWYYHTLRAESAN